MNFPVFSQLSRELGFRDAGSAASHQHATQIAAPESETRPHPPRCVPGRSNRGFISGDATGYEDVNDADRLCRDPAMRWVVGDRGGHQCAASASQMGRFETKWLS